MKSLTGLWKAMADDQSAICDTPIDRDWETVLDRVKDEGMSFFDNHSSCIRRRLRKKS
jgi:hypothetical protein